MERQQNGQYLASWTSASMDFACVDAAGGWHDHATDPFLLIWMSRNGTQSNYLAGASSYNDDAETFLWFQRN